VATGGTALVVPSLTLEAILDANLLARCDLLKVDIEGAEYEVLESSRRVLHRVGRIVMEHHKTPTKSASDAVKLLGDSGFEVTVVNNYLFASQPDGTRLVAS
jgi:hypothetical protein